MEPIGIITWIIIGIATGWLVGQVLPIRIRLGLAQGDALAGMLGAMFAGSLFNGLAEGSAGELSLGNMLAAFTGAILMLFLLRAASEQGKAAYSAVPVLQPSRKPSLIGLEKANDHDDDSY